jgi:hypothetical protein
MFIATHQRFSIRIGVCVCVFVCMCVYCDLCARNGSICFASCCDSEKKNYIYIDIYDIISLRINIIHLNNKINALAAIKDPWSVYCRADYRVEK